MHRCLRRAGRGTRLLPASAAAPLICTRLPVPAQTVINSRLHPHSAAQDCGSHNTDESEDAVLPLSRKTPQSDAPAASFRRSLRPESSAWFFHINQ